MWLLSLDSKAKPLPQIEHLKQVTGSNATLEGAFCDEHMEVDRSDERESSVGGVLREELEEEGNGDDEDLPDSTAFCSRSVLGEECSSPRKLLVSLSG